MTEGERRRMGDVLKKYNIRDSKRFFSEINRQAQEGVEVITYDGLRPNQGEVSHLKTEVLDRILATFEFHPELEFDEHIKVWTASVAELPVYGEDTEVFYANLRWFLSREETLSDCSYVRQKARCGGDRKKIADLIGPLPHAN